MKRRIKLGVNIDHIATLRQARREAFPDPLLAAAEAVRGGADGIVMHLREDRRHIQDADLYNVRKKIKARLDLEMAATEEMQKIALDVLPDMVTLVPEKREELTTEGGLDVAGNVGGLRSFIEPLRKKKMNVSLFVDPDIGQVMASSKTGANFVEIHTGAYANAKTGAERSRELKKVAESAALARTLGLRVNAGHGLDYYNVGDIVRIPEIEELNIGFSVIARAVLAGIRAAVSEMKKAMAL